MNGAAHHDHSDTEYHSRRLLSGHGGSPVVGRPVTLGHTLVCVYVDAGSEET